MFSYFLAKNHAVCEITYKNNIDPDRPYDNLISGMRIACGYVRVSASRSLHGRLVGRMVQCNVNGIAQEPCRNRPGPLPASWSLEELFLLKVL
jgi:hypothetical protein